MRIFKLTSDLRLQIFTYLFFILHKQQNFENKKINAIIETRSFAPGSFKMPNLSLCVTVNSLDEFTSNITHYIIFCEVVYLKRDSVQFHHDIILLLCHFHQVLVFDSVFMVYCCFYRQLTIKTLRVREQSQLFTRIPMNKCSCIQPCDFLG